MFESALKWTPALWRNGKVNKEIIILVTFDKERLSSPQKSGGSLNCAYKIIKCQYLQKDERRRRNKKKRHLHLF